MKNNPLFVLALFFFLFQSVGAQETRTIQAIRLAHPPKIDGKIDDSWGKVPAVKNFYEFYPGFGEPIPPAYHTEVKVSYDDTGIYILAVMQDPHPDKIMRVFGLRDQFSVSDLFGIMINPFRAPGNNYLFMVSAGGTQLDGLQGQDTDLSWNAVWKSAVAITDRGWVVEMAIPYSALRFPKKEEQIWAVNFFREITSIRKKYSWILIDKTKQVDPVAFTGELRGIRNIKPPVRLSFYPYSSVNLMHYKGESKISPAFGLDLKYGLNENFTLDATLIPDFSDVPYDEIVLNLGPFEQFYSENRPFFTEGMQLFNKGRIFYSRRIGGRPIDFSRPFYEKTSTEIIEKNPEKTNLINAIKLSGRTDNGLGIGILNAITNKSEAVLTDTVTGNSRHVLTSPYTNYNVAVIDYVFGKNNVAGIMNTNTLRAGSYKDANVTSLFYTLYLQHNTLKISGKSNMSLIMDSARTAGFFGNLDVYKKINGHEFGIEFMFKDDKYDIRDLGFMHANNIVIYDFFYKYSILKPIKYFNRLKFAVDVGLDHVYKPYGIYRKDIGFRVFATTKKQLSLGGGIKFISDTKDYYEPRLPGRFYLDPAKMMAHIFVSTDYRKKLAFDAGIGGHNYLASDGSGFRIRLSPLLRLSNQFSMRYMLIYNKIFDEKGFVRIKRGDIIFGKRNKKSISQNLSANYYFTVKSALSLSFRHYWAPVHYTAFYKLKEDGTLTPIPDSGRNENINFNVWNFDFGYTWEFAPGSQLTLLYRNNLQEFNRKYDLTYAENLDQLFKQPQRHNFIVKAIYYLDYNTVIRKWF